MAAPGLAEDAAHVRIRPGVVSKGERRREMGTRNHLLRLGPETFLNRTFPDEIRPDEISPDEIRPEVIAVDAEAVPYLAGTPPPHRRWPWPASAP